MDCKIIKDLIPLSEEGLCSEESKAMIEEHIKDCESCRLLCEKMPVDSKSAPVPDEKETFKKVNRKIKKLTWKSAVLGVFLAAILIPLAYLTFGQITKMEGLHSFETIIQSLEVRKMAKYIANKDFDSLVREQGHSFEEYIFGSPSIIDDIKATDKKILKETYEKEFGNTKVKSISVYSEYWQTGFSDNSYSIYNFVFMKYEDGREIRFGFIKESDGLYRLVSGYPSEENYSEFAVALNYFSYHKYYYSPYDDFANGKTDFRKEYSDSYVESRKSFRKAGFEVDNCSQSEYNFDDEKNMLYYDITIEASDDKGSAILTTRLYYDYLGFYPPERDTITVYTDNCTPELEEAMYNFFG